MEFTFEVREDCILLRPARRFEGATLDEVVGCLGYAGPVKTLEEKEEGIARMVREQHARGRYEDPPSGV